MRKFWVIVASLTACALVVSCGDDGGESAGNNTDSAAWCEAYGATLQLPVLPPNEPEEWVNVVDTTVAAYQRLAELAVSGEDSEPVPGAVSDLVDIFTELRQRLASQGPSTQVLSTFFAESNERLERANSPVEMFAQKACAETSPADPGEPTHGKDEQSWDCLMNPDEC